MTVSKLKTQKSKTKLLVKLLTASFIGSIVLSACVQRSYVGENQGGIVYSGDSEYSFTPLERSVIIDGDKRYMSNNTQNLLNNNFLPIRQQFASKDNRLMSPIEVVRDNYLNDNYVSTPTFYNNVESGVKSFINGVYGAQAQPLENLTERNNLDPLDPEVYKAKLAEANDQYLTIFSNDTRQVVDVAKANNKYVWLGDVQKNMFDTSDEDNQEMFSISADKPTEPKISNDLVAQNSAEQKTNYTKLFENYGDKSYVDSNHLRLSVLSANAVSYMKNYVNTNYESYINPNNNLESKFNNTGVGFVVVGGSINNARTASIIYKEVQMGFLIGFATGVFLNYENNLATFMDADKQLKVGMIGGSKNETTIMQLSGFQQGINFFNQQLADKTVTFFQSEEPTKIKPVNIVYFKDTNSLFNKTVEQFTNSTNYLINNGARFIYTSLGYGGTVERYNAILDTISKSDQTVALGSAYGIDFSRLASNYVPHSTVLPRKLSLNNQKLAQINKKVFNSSLFQFQGYRNLSHTTAITLNAINLNYYTGNYDAKFDGFGGLGHVNAFGVQDDGINLSHSTNLFVLKGIKAILELQKNDRLKYVTNVETKSPEAFVSKEYTTPAANPNIKPNVINDYDLFKYLNGVINNLSSTLYATPNAFAENLPKQAVLVDPAKVVYGWDPGWAKQPVMVKDKPKQTNETGVN